MLFYSALFLLAFVYASLLEWVIHKYLFHGAGKNKKSSFAGHWHIHHKLCRKNDNADEIYIHRRCHVDVEWGKRNFPWHYDHHMGKNQDANWGVTNPLWDHILKTRIKYF